MAHFINIECVGCGACKRVCPVSCISGAPKSLHEIDRRACIDCGACGIVCPVSCIEDARGKKYAFLKPKERPWAEVNPELCTACEYCVDVCPFSCLDLKSVPGVSFQDSFAFNAHPGKCASCRLCVQICPKETIQIVYPEQGGEKKSA